MIQDADLKKMFVIEGSEARQKFKSKSHTKKYERLIEVKAFLNTQQLLAFKVEEVDPVLPALVAARERHAQLVKDVQALNAVSSLACAVHMSIYRSLQSYQAEAGLPNRA